VRGRDNCKMAGAVYCFTSVKCYWDGEIKEHGAASTCSSTGDVDLKCL
jgi:hypothetical protein